MLRQTDILARIALVAILIGGCKSRVEDSPVSPSKDEVDKPTPKAPPTAVPVTPAATATELPALPRNDFNRLAVIAHLPLFWRADDNNKDTVDADELVVLSGSTDKYVAGGKLTPAFDAAYNQLLQARRTEAVRKELNQGRITLVETDFTKRSAEQVAVMKELQAAARLLDELYQTQTGALPLRAKIPKDDTASHALYQRNNGPDCAAPATADDSFCSAAANFGEPRSFAYPEGPTLDKAFCDMLGKQPNAKELLDPFVVVRKDGDGYKAVPYTEVYGQRMKKIGARLKAAAAAIKSEDEAAFKAYLLAAAQGFDTNVWWDADEAWSKMNGRNSKWYLRVGPDETYFDPCQVKSGFHMSLAFIDRSALEWQDKLTKLRQQMETAVAATIGAPYKAREVGFQLPEFIEIIINAGDSRGGLGATIGQSLPNFGKVAAESRGRTVAMANLYTDPDSMRIARARAQSLFVAATMKHFSDDPSASRLDTVLHEAMHNFGPTGSWKVDGKKPEEVFGGRLDAILEELKAQTGSFYFLNYLQKEGAATADEVKAGYVSSIAWAFGHICRCMFTSSGKPRTYSVLAAIQLHWFMEAGAITFTDGGDGPDPGRFEIHFDKMPAAIDSLMKKVGGIKARGDKAAGQAMVDTATSDKAQRAMHAPLITERVLRYPKASFAYRIIYP